MLLRSLSVCVLLALPGVALGESEVRAVEECVAGNLPDESGRLDFQLRVRDREGGLTRSAAELLWRRPPQGLSRMLLRITEPERTRGTSVLIVEREDDDPEVYVHLPEISKVKRVRKSRLKGSLLGTDFSYEDFERLQGLAQKTEVVLREELDLAGRAVWVLEARPGENRKSEYSRVFTYVDQEYCLPLRMEFVDRKGQLRKVLSTDPDTVRREGPRFVPAGFRMRDLRDRTETELVVKSVAIDPGLSAEQFTQQALTAVSP